MIPHLSLRCVSISYRVPLCSSNPCTLWNTESCAARLSVRKEGSSDTVSQCLRVRPEASWARSSPPRDGVGATALTPLLYIGQMSLGNMFGTLSSGVCSAPSEWATSQPLQSDPTRKKHTPRRIVDI